MNTALEIPRVAKFLLLGSVAVGGSLLFGAAAGAVLPAISIAKGGLLLTLSTGCSWLVFGALLIMVTKKPILSLAEICLVTMAYGEAVLVSGAACDWALLRPGVARLDPAWTNGLIVLAADILMCAMFASQLSRSGVARRTSIGLWVLGLNGSWAVFLWVFIRVLYR